MTLATRLQTGSYLLAGLLALLGTLALFFTDVNGASPEVRLAAGLLTVLWAAAWLGLLRQERLRRRVLAREQRSQQLLASISEARRRILSDGDPRDCVVSAAIEVTGARLATLSEVQGPFLVTTTAAGGALPDIRLPLDSPSIAKQVLDDGEPRQVRNIHDERGAAHPVIAALEAQLRTEIHSVAYVPVHVDGTAVAILSAAFTVTDVALADRATPILQLLASEVALCIHRETLISRLRTQATTDDLTHIGNLRAWRTALRTSSRVGGIALFDLDHFKLVNDQHGHAAGDEVLRQFADVLTRTVRAEDTIARIGGEEFAVLVHAGDDLAPLVGRMRDAWAASGVHVTFSAGIAVRVRREDPESLQQRCDRALYAAKEAGRNRVVTAQSPVQT